MAVEAHPLNHLEPLIDGARLSSLPVEVLHPLMPWRVHERGRVAHRVIGGVATCGEQGTRWRRVAGIPSCSACERFAAGPG